MMMRSVTPMRTAKTGYIVMSAIMVILGIVLIASPEALAPSMCTVMGIAAAVFGAIKIVSYFSKDLFRLAFQHDLAEGILLLILGITGAVRPELLMKFMGMAFGICVLADGLLKIQVALDAKAFGVSKWWLILTAAVLTGIAGFFLLINPVESASVAAVVLGISLLAEGALNLITVLTAVKIVRNQMPDDVITVTSIHTH